MLSQDLFRNVVRDTCLIAIDFIVRDADQKILLGLRKNSPAKDYWFVPGGRIFKGERLNDAIERIGHEEMGQRIIASKLKWIGVSDHIYSDNVFSDPTFGTHYLVLAVEFCREVGADPIFISSQHNGLRWLSEEEVLADPSVHPFTKRYFEHPSSTEFTRFKR